MIEDNDLIDIFRTCRRLGALAMVHAEHGENLLCIILHAGYIKLYMHYCSYGVILAPKNGLK